MTTSPEGGRRKAGRLTEWSIDYAGPPQPPRRKCTRCGVTRERGWRHWRHRLFVCNPDRLAMLARVHRPPFELWPGEEAF